MNNEKEHQFEQLVRRHKRTIYTPEASLLWYQFTSAAAGHRAALYLNGIKIQDWQIKCGISCGSFFIMKEHSSMKELDAFCEQLIRQ